MEVHSSHWDTASKHGTCKNPMLQGCTVNQVTIRQWGHKTWDSGNDIWVNGNPPTEVWYPDRGKTGSQARTREGQREQEGKRRRGGTRRVGGTRGYK